MRSLSLLLILAASAAGAKADSLTYTVTPSAGDFIYDFSLTNTGATGGTLYDLFLDIPQDISDINTSTIGTPVGWGDPTGGLLFYGSNTGPGTAFIEWAADASGTYDLGIGNSLSGFSFETSNEVSPISFALNGSPNFSAAEPSSIPEPSGLSLSLFGAGLLGLAVRRLKRVSR